MLRNRAFVRGKLRVLDSSQNQSVVGPMQELAVYILQAASHEIEIQLKKDITRTFPRHVMFKNIADVVIDHFLALLAP